MKNLLELIDGESLEKLLFDEPSDLQTLGITLYLEMITDILRCITDLEGGVRIEFEEIRDFLNAKEAHLTCSNGMCEITLLKTTAHKGFKLFSVRFLTIFSAHKSFSIH